MVPTSNLRWSHRTHLLPYVISASLAMPDDAEEPTFNPPAESSEGWLRLGPGGSPEDTLRRGSLDQGPGPAMDLFPTYPCADWSYRICQQRQVALPAVRELRVAVPQPPARPQAGLWFALRAVDNQRKGPSLPQIRKSYLRIKDGRMTVRLLMRYLVSKLGLRHESEVLLKSFPCKRVDFIIFKAL